MAKYLIFNLSKTRFGLPIDKIVEVKPFEDITLDESLPWPSIAAVQLRGDDVPIIDFYALLSGEKRREKDYSNCKEILMLEKNKVICGFLVDVTIGVIDINQTEILPLPKHIPGINNQYYLGLKRVDKSFNLILNQDKIFDDALRN